MRYNGRKIIFTSILASVSTFIILILVVGYVGTRIGNPFDSNNEASPDVTEQTPTPQQISTETERAPATVPVVDVASRSIKPVVGIAVLKPDGNSIFRTDANEKWGVGSGIIVDSNGYILTNHHVAGGKNKRIIVTLDGGESLDGTTLWSDSVIDLAVVKVNVTGLPTAKLGNSNDLKIGEPAIAIGNPLGLQLQRTVTSGIVSALNRTVQIQTNGKLNYMEDLIQTDASINPGNSGGPLMNAQGEVIGINTVKVESAEGIGFAIPINLAKPIVESFTKKGSFDEPYLGLFAYDKEIMPYVEPSLNMDGGIYVVQVDAGGPAAKSGIKIGDVIKSLDGKLVQTMVDLRTILYSKKPNEQVTLRVVKDGSERVITTTLGKKTGDGLVTR